MITTRRVMLSTIMNKTRTISTERKVDACVTTQTRQGRVNDKTAQRALQLSSDLILSAIRCHNILWHICN
jgi:hypothetical protein